MSYVWLTPYIGDLAKCNKSNFEGEIVAIRNNSSGMCCELINSKGNVHYALMEDVEVIKPIYYEISVECSTLTDTWITDEDNALVQSERGSYKTRLRPGIYFIFGLGESHQVVNLYRDMVIE